MINKIPVEKNEIVTMDIEDLGIHGEGIGRIDGYTLFVDGGLIGEKVEVKVVKVKKNFGYGKLLHIIMPSKDRIEPKCPVSRQCGGCQLQHMSYKSQLAYKTKKVQDVMERIGKLEGVKVNETIGMDEPWMYRNKVSYPVRNDNGLSKIGFFSSRSHRVVEHKTCYIQKEGNDAIVSVVKEWMLQFGISPYDEEKGTGMVRHIMIRHSAKKEAFHVTIVFNKRKMKHLDELVSRLKSLGFIDGISTSVHLEKNNVILGEQVNLLWGELYLEEDILDQVFQISPKSFFQVNLKQTEVLYGKVLEMASLTGEETVLDLYCGIGTITLALAKQAKKAIGVEIIEAAIADAYKNAEINGLTNTEFYIGSVESIIPQLYEEENLSADVVVVDPPRKGCEETLLKTVVDIAPKRMVYVSCDPGTLARDVKYMCQHGYQVEEIQPVDMFPHTLHVETVLRMIKHN